MAFKLSLLLQTLFLPLLSIALAPAASTPAYQAGFARWRAADGAFATWQMSGATLAQGGLALDPASADMGSDPAGTYNGGNFYNGGSYIVGTATGPVISTPFGFTEAIASWNADTPAGTWIETHMRAQVGGRWTKWYSMGVWAADDSTVRRHSVAQQGDADGYVATDTLVLAGKKAAATAFQVQVRLFRAADSSAVPSVRAMAVAYSTAAPKKATLSAGDPALWNTLIDVPQCSQMVYPDGGEVWCSPTSTSMVLGYWSQDSGPCAPRVRDAVAGVYDWIYDGHGNWPFNTAYAATKRAASGAQIEGYVARFTSLAQAEPWIKAGVPVIVSLAWKKDLTGAPIPSSNGHLAVLVGFDKDGNPIVNDPAAASDATVRRTYIRAEFEARWLEASGGTVYLIYPAGMETPAL
jgi:hypothetical protein